ncbi:MAG: SPOR domain-containing protein [Deltaproteobacteria bacterium]|nr:MAG: SPOR domain-containing protein [Deltaproteobacteria bacterium]
MASTLARAALARAADAGARCVSCEIVDEAAAVYAGPPDDAVRRSTAYVTNTATSTAAVGLIVVALVLAAAQIRLAGDGSAPVEARLMGLSGSRHPSEHVTSEKTIELAQKRGTPRETFLSDRPYEVQIKPPPRPGAAAPETAKPPEKPVAAPPAGTPAIEKVESATHEAGPARPAAEAPAAPASPAPAVRPETAPSAGTTETSSKITGSATTKPWVSLQVGAFRNLKSAHALQRKLAKTFSDVYISTVESGGEPLYRVRVGRFRTADESLELKSRLLAAGFPSFRVTER